MASFQQEVEQAYQEFKESWRGETNIETIDSVHKYNDVVNDLVDSVLYDFASMVENSGDHFDYGECRRAIEEVVQGSSYCIYSSYAPKIYCYSPYTEAQLDIYLEDFKCIKDALESFAGRSLELSVQDNKYISRVLNLVI